MAYTPVGWKNYPSKDTPLSAENLKKMDDGILENSNNIENIKVKNAELEGKCNSLSTEVATLKKSVSDGKKSVADAITAKGVSTAADATFAVMAANIGTMADKKYNAGVTAADGRVNSSSASYQSGRTQGQNDVKGSPNSYGLYTSSQYSSYGTQRYNAGYSAGQSAAVPNVKTGKVTTAANCYASISTGLSKVYGIGVTNCDGRVSSISASGVSSSEPYVTVSWIAVGK